MLALLLTLSAAQCPGGVCPQPAVAYQYAQPARVPVLLPPVVYYPQNPPVLRLVPTYQAQPVYYYRPVDNGAFLQYWPPISR